jgi:hypothetical protein
MNRISSFRAAVCGVERVSMRPWDAGPAPVLGCGFDGGAAGLAAGSGLGADGAGGARGDVRGPAPLGI